MWNILEYNQIARGEGVRLFTACGIFEGVYRGSEAVDESQPEQWVVLSDVTFSPARGSRRSLRWIWTTVVPSGRQTAKTEPGGM